MKKLFLTFTTSFIAIFVGMDCINAENFWKQVTEVNKTVSTAWGASQYGTIDSSGHNEKGDYPGLKSKVTPENFVIQHKWATACNGTKEDDTMVALVAKRITKNGGEFVPMTIRCDQNNGAVDRWGGWIRYFANSDSDKGTWLCADGYSGERCENTSDATMVENYKYFQENERDALSLNEAFEITDDVNVFSDYSWKYNSDTRKGNVVLAIVGYTKSGKGAFAAPVNIRCTGTRYSPEDGYDICTSPNIFRAFDGKFKPFYIDGKKRLVCASGYTPNEAKDDCVSDTTNSNAPRVTEMNTSGQYTTYIGDDIVDLIEAQKARKGYNEAEHSVAQYIDSKGIERYGVFCRDKTKGIVSDQDLTCEKCTSGLKMGVCLSDYHDGFGKCSKCAPGEIYNPKECKCVKAVALSATDMAYGQGNNSKDGTNTCWTKETEEDYRDCVIKKQ